MRSFLSRRRAASRLLDTEVAKHEDKFGIAFIGLRSASWHIVAMATTLDLPEGIILR